MRILTDIIKYFAKFPDNAGVLKNFSRDTEKIPGYDALKTYISGLGTPVVPEILDFVFGFDEKVVAERIKQTKSYFLFLEFGRINMNTPDSKRLRDTDIHLAITVAHDMNDRNRDSVEEMLISEQCLAYLNQILTQMKQDDQAICENNRYLDSNIEISPIRPRFFYQNTGWVATFMKKEPQLI